MTVAAAHVGRRRSLLHLTPGLLEQAFDVLRSCGAGRRECVV